MTRMVALATGVLALAACAQPQTATAFKEAVAKGGFRTATDSFSVARPYLAVVTDIRERAEKGWNYVHREAGMLTTRETYAYQETYRCGSSVGEGKADIFVQKEPRPRGVGPSMPEGGWFTLVVQVTAAEKETTVKIFGAGVPSAAFEAIRKWAEGIDAPCPALR